MVLPAGGTLVGWTAVGTKFGLGGVMGGGLLRSLNRQHGGATWTGRYLLRNLQFLMVILPDPSTHITYWSYCLTSTMIPVLSDHVGCGPVWFWILTLSPITRGGKPFGCLHVLLS